MRTTLWVTTLLVTALLPANSIAAMCCQGTPGQYEVPQPVPLPRYHRSPPPPPVQFRRPPPSYMIYGPNGQVYQAHPY